MTSADELRAAGRAGDEAAAQALLADRSEANRTELIPIAREVVAAEKRKGIGALGHLPATLLVAYGLLPVSDIRKLGWWSNHLPNRLQDVLRRRSPERLVPIVEYLLDNFGFHAWRPVRTLVREGVVPRPARPSYTIAMLSATRHRGAAELLAEDPALLEVEVWRLFEVEGGGEDSLANHEKFFGDTWGKVFRDLAAGDDAVRRRFLDVSLAALACDFATYRAGWFSRFHESLAPTDDERAERAEAYLGLLRSRVGPTISLAVSALTRIQRAGRLPPDALLERIGPVLAEASAGAAKTGLNLVGRAGAGSAHGARRAAVAASDALANASPEVQRAAIALIGKLVHGTDDAVARAIAVRLPDVASSQRAAAADLVARLIGDSAAAAPAHPPSVAGDAVPSVPRSPSPTDPDRAIKPLSSLEALVDVAVSVLETGEPADEVERVLDAVGRLAADRPEHFARLTGPIARRARMILARRESSPFTGRDVRADVAAVLLAWTSGDLVDPGPVHPSVDPGVGAFLSARAREVAEAAAGRRSFVGVAAPTHTGGWIDPAVLIRRLGARLPPSRLDLVAAMLRLAPAGRDAALASAAGLTGEVGAVVRYALGGDEPIGATAAWWVAAARVRAPGQDDAAVEKRHPGLGPDAGRAARMRLSVADTRGFAAVSLKLEIDPPPAGATSVDLPTVLMLRNPSSFFRSGPVEPAMFRWVGTIQPGHREGWSAIGAVMIGRNVDWWSVEWANRAFLEPFIDPVTAIGPHALALLGIALGAKEAGERGLATDVVRLALADGRLTASSLAEGLSASAAVTCDRPNRWAPSLADVAAHSHAHATAVAEAVARTLPALAGRPSAKLVPLLRLLDELLAGTGRPSAEDARPPLERLVAAGGQAGRLARSILSRG